MRMKKLISLTLALVMACSLFTGCSTLEGIKEDLGLNKTEETETVVNNEKEDASEEKALTYKEQRIALLVEMTAEEGEMPEELVGLSDEELYEYALNSMIETFGGEAALEELRNQTEEEFREYMDTTLEGYDEENLTEEEREAMESTYSGRALNLLIKEYKEKDSFTADERVEYQKELAYWMMVMLSEAFSQLDTEDFEIDYEDIEVGEGVTMTYTDEDGNTVEISGNGEDRVVTIVEETDEINTDFNFKEPQFDDESDLTVEFTPLEDVDFEWKDADFEWED